MAEIVPFPLQRRVGLIRQTANRIHRSRTTREATALWRRSAETLFRQMDRIGIEQDKSDAEVRAFHYEVCAELDYLATGSVEPGGSAA